MIYKRKLFVACKYENQSQREQLEFLRHNRWDLLRIDKSAGARHAMSLRLIRESQRGVSNSNAERRYYLSINSFIA